MENMYSLSFAFTINAFWIYWSILACVLVALVYKAIKLKNKKEEKRSRLNAINHESCTPVEIAILFNQLKEIGCEELIKNAKHLIVDKNILDSVLTGNILRVIKLNNITIAFDIMHDSHDIALMHKKTENYLIVLTDNDKIAYGLHMAIDKEFHAIEIHNRIYLPFKINDSIYKLCSFKTLSDLAVAIVSVDDMSLAINDFVFINKMDIIYPQNSFVRICAVAIATKESISGSREYSKHFWQPDITRIILTEVENESK